MGLQARQIEQKTTRGAVSQAPPSIQTGGQMEKAATSLAPPPPKIFPQRKARATLIRFGSGCCTLMDRGGRNWSSGSFPRDRVRRRICPATPLVQSPKKGFTP